MTALVKEICLCLWRTALVTLVIALGFGVGNLVGLPSWLQGFCLLPGCYLFGYLAGQKLPALGTMLCLIAILSGVTFLVLTIIPRLPAWIQGAALVLLISFNPVRPLIRFFDSIFSRESTRNARQSE